MVKITKLSDLTDIQKLKQLGSSIVDPTKVGSLVDKVKSTVTEPGKMGDLMGKMKSSVGLGEKMTTNVPPTQPTDLQTQAAIIQQTLQSLYEAQKQQLAIMNALKKQVNNLVAAATATAESPPMTDSNAESMTEEQLSEELVPKNKIPDDTV